jgi:hypothetical protein
MLNEVNENEYFNFFNSSKNFFLTKNFTLINKDKVEKVIYLINDAVKPSIGIILGVKHNNLMSPYSAPFGGFNYTHSNIYIDVIEEFAENLKTYFYLKKYSNFKCIFPPTIYGSSFNHKMINTMVRKGFNIEIPELTSFVDLDDFHFRFAQKNSREYYSQALKKKLIFKQIFDAENQIEIINLIKENRERSNRKLRMSFDDFKKIENIFNVNYFGVFDSENHMVASSIYYLFPSEKLVYTVIWGDTINGRELRAMDFLTFESWSFFKRENYKYVDLGISTEADAIPNVGLLRFKETHEAKTELRFTLTLSLQ